MTQPGEIDGSLLAELRAHFTPEQLLELSLKVMKFNIQKTMVALGTDVPVDPDAVDELAWNPEGTFVAARKAPPAGRDDHPA